MASSEWAKCVKCSACCTYVWWNGYATNTGGTGNNVGSRHTSICRAYHEVIRNCLNTGNTRVFDLSRLGLRRAVWIERFTYGSVRGLGVKFPFAYSTFLSSVLVNHCQYYVSLSLSCRVVRLRIFYFQKGRIFFLIQFYLRWKGESSFASFGLSFDLWGLQMCFHLCLDYI